jgi:hypothetical protein
MDGTLRRRAPTMLVAALALAVLPLLAVAAPAAASLSTFPCVVQHAKACVVTIQLTSNMDEQVGSTMPDQHPWTLNIVSGTEGTGGSTLSGPARHRPAETARRARPKPRCGPRCSRRGP